LISKQKGKEKKSQVRAMHKTSQNTSLEEIFIYNLKGNHYLTTLLKT
jgi:hypothetical protein